MTDTDFSVPDGKTARLVPVHRRRSDGTFEATDNQPRAPVNGGGGLFSTGRDYATFMQMILNGGALNGVRILSADSVRVMGENQISTAACVPSKVHSLIAAATSRSSPTVATSGASAS